MLLHSVKCIFSFDYFNLHVSKLPKTLRKPILRYFFTKLSSVNEIRIVKNRRSVCDAIIQFYSQKLYTHECGTKTTVTETIRCEQFIIFR